jgi:hypothetical protein
VQQSYGHAFPIHLVTVKVKVDSSLLIKIIVSIKIILVLVEGFYLFGLPTYCTKATVILNESLSLAVVNCE